jgi:adenylylsulfate kinase-like enzyme
VAELTGVSAPYEAPDAPELRLDTCEEGVQALVERVVSLLRKAKLLSPE